MGTWTKDSAGVWTLSGSGDTVVVAPTFMPRTCALKLQAVKPSHQCGSSFWMSRDGRSRYRSRASGANWVIERVDFAGAPTVVATAAHLLTADTPFTAETRIINSKVEVYLNGSDSALLSWDNSAGTYTKQRHWGFESGTAGAQVLASQVCDLVADPAGKTEVLIWVNGGDLYFSLDGEQATLLKSGAFRQTGPVSLAAFEQFVYGVDRSSAWKIDLNSLTAEKAGGTTAATAFPGASETSVGSGVYVPGTTTMAFLSNFLNRLVASDGKHLYMSAIANGDDWNTGSDSPGRAFATPVDLPGRMGEPITCFFQTDSGVGIIGCQNSTWIWIGDPAIALPKLERIEGSSGISGKDAVTLAEGGIAVAHSPDGAFRISGAGGMLSFSGDSLTEGIQLPRGSIAEYTVSVVRDSRRRRVLFFLTPSDETAAAVHFSYNERVGRYQDGRGGFFPWRMSARIGPTCAVVYKGEVLIWTRDGYVLGLNDETAADDGEAIDLKFTVLADEPDIAVDTVLEELRIVLAKDSADLPFSVYVANTAQEALVGTDRLLKFSATAKASQPAKPIRRRVSAPSIVMDFRQATLGQRVAVEAVQAVTSIGHTLHRHRRAVPAAPPSPCSPPVAASGGGGFDPPPVVIPTLERFLADVYGFQTAQLRTSAAYADGRDPFSGGSGGGGGDPDKTRVTAGNWGTCGSTRIAVPCG